MTWMAHPYGFAATNTTRLRDDAGHVRDMLELVLFTAPGERVNRPDFVAGSRRCCSPGTVRSWRCRSN